MSKQACSYLLFSVSIVSVLYVSGILFPSVLFIYPRTFGEEIEAKIFSLFILIILSVLCVLWFYVSTRMENNNILSSLFSNKKSHTYNVFFLIFISVAPFLVSYFVLLGSPLTPDEFVYVFQAQIFSQGAIFVAAPPVPEIFTTVVMVEQNGRWAGAFPPGWSAIAAVAIALDLPAWAVNPLLGMVSIVLVYYLASLQYSRSTALCASIIYSTSIFFIFNSASFFSHVSFVVVILLYAVYVVLFSRTQRSRYLFAAGVALSAAFTIRYYPAILLAIPLLFYLYKWRTLAKGVGLLALGGIPLTTALVVYQALVFGSPFRTGYSWQTAYFPTFSLDILSGIYVDLIRLWELVGWASPVLVVMYLAAMVHRVRSRSISFTDTLFPVLFLGLVLFPEPGAYRYGPRYFFDAFPFFVICAVAGVFDYVGQKSETVQNAARHAVLMTVVYSLCMLPFVAGYFHRVAWERAEVGRLIEAQNLRNAIVIVRSGLGRLLPAAVTEFVRNDPGLKNDVLFVRPIDDEVLTAHFPSRAIWAFEKSEPAAPGGQLVRVR